MKNLLFVILIVLSYSCSTTHKPPIAYFGGEIVNPKDEYVILFYNDKAVDTAKLDHRNRFSFKLENFDQGLYNFKHKPEYQYVIIENGDSILIRLNTLSFDESLVFSGKGAEKNNFMIDMFLFNEDEEKLVYNYYALDANMYAAKMDSLRTMKLEQYNSLVDNFNVSAIAKNITKAAIDYTHYSNMELYPYVHKKNNSLEDLNSLPQNFHTYKKDINYNDASLSYFRPYLNFMVMHFNHMSYIDCKKDCKHQGEIVERSLHYHIHKLNLIDSLVNEPNLRDNLFRNAAYTYLLEDHNIANNEKFITKFNEFSKNNRHADEIIQLYNGKRLLETGNIIPDVNLVKLDGMPIHIKDIPQGTNTVYYFWSLNQMNHLKNLHRKIMEIQSQHPQYKYVGINVNGDQTEWLNAIDKLNLDKTQQYRCDNFDEMSKKLILNDWNKLIILEGNGAIINAFANAYDHNLGNQLEDTQLVKL